MSDWSLPRILDALHDSVEQQLLTARKTLGHPVTKGDASEDVWLKLLRVYLPHRYQAEKAHVVDSRGGFSEQIDIVVFDRQYSPFIFEFQNQIVIPAESVYAVFEAKQTVNAGLIEYAQRKIASVRTLYRTSLPIPHAGGVYDPKPLPQIVGGFLALESDWSPALGDSLRKALEGGEAAGRLDLGCIAAHGMFTASSEGAYAITPAAKATTAFLFELMARLQASATVPMIDIRAYAHWLSK